MTPAVRQRLLRLLSQNKLLRARDIAALGLARRHLSELVDEGLLVRAGRGLYASPQHAATENHSLATISKRVPDAVVCLLSALRFHGLTTQAPAEVWIAVKPTNRTPVVRDQLVRVCRFSGSAYSEGIQRHRVEGVLIPVYNPAKTVADCFKFRNRVGTDVAMEALRDVWSKRLATADELWKYAKVCRVLNVMRPYMETVV